MICERCDTRKADSSTRLQRSNELLVIRSLCSECMTEFEKLEEAWCDGAIIKVTDQK